MLYKRSDTILNHVDGLLEFPEDSGIRISTLKLSIYY